MKQLFIIDALNVIFRAYYAIPKMSNGQGQSTNALYGFIRILLKLAKDFSPDHLVVVFDGEDNARSRKEIFPDYKANRDAAPEDLPSQVELAKTFCSLFGLPMLSLPGVEADDTMGSIATWAESCFDRVFLCSSDKDLAQLVSDKVHLLHLHKDNKVINSEGVQQIYGVRPDQIVDFLAITGDTSDNVPGLPGFGPKTASSLLQKLGSLDEILSSPEKVPGPKKQQTLKEHQDLAKLSRRLVTLDLGCETPQEPSFFQIDRPDRDKLAEFLQSMDFRSLLKDQALEGKAPKPAATYHIIQTEKELTELTGELKKHTDIALDVETDALAPLTARLVGIGLAFDASRAYYIPFNGDLEESAIWEALGPILKNPKIGFFGHNIKYDLQVLSNYGMGIQKVSFDTMLASYLLSAHERRHSLTQLTHDILKRDKIEIDTIIGKGKSAITLAEAPIDKVGTYCCEDVEVTFALKDVLEPQLKERGLVSVLDDIELPLINVLADMERRGVYLDVDALKSYSSEIVSKIKTLESEIFALAGEEFNLNSPKQLGQILFEKLAIPPPKKTKTGYSTSAEVLEFLKPNYPITALILDYRSLEKLRSTYVDALPHEVSSKTGRVHSTFNQSVAATGRLSSQNPNLQNIPVRTEEGRRVRAAFRPEKEGWSYVSADYSQIELRLLAHFSEDPTLIETFSRGGDVHKACAAQIFHVPESEVTKEMRYQAKAVNFGVIYGQQAFGLSRELGIDVKTASKFIEKYFEKYSHVQAFVQKSIESVENSGKAKTLTGRERLIPDINSKNGLLRAAAHRLAVNTPLQGTAADLIKLAMLEVDKAMKKAKAEGYLVLQIHDELIFEVPDHEIELVRSLVRPAMEEIWKLRVPLLVDISVGKNWKEC